MSKIGMAVWVLLVIALAGLPAGVQAQSDDGLMAEWHFDEGSGNVVKDSSGNGNNGVIYGATWVEGKYGKALSFDGVDDYVDCGSNEFFEITNDDFSFEAWFKSSVNVNNYQVILDKGDIIHNENFKFVSFSITRNGLPEPSPSRLFMHISDGDEINEYDVKSTNKVIDGKWHHGAAVVDLSDQKMYLYLDGTLNDITYISEFDRFSISNDLFIGKTLSRNDNCFNGLIDEVCIYDRALSAEEVKEHFEQGPTTLSLVKTASLNSIKQGQTTTITLTVKNTGTTEIKDIEVADTIPQNLTFVDGETLKTYSSLTPKDSRQFQYVVRLNEAGTYNLNPATATYADEEGEYHIVKSKPVAIQVIPSLVENTDQIQRTGGSNAQTASVHLHGEKTDVVMGEDILLKLAAVNLITKPTMHVQVIITPPSGMSVTSSEFVQSGAGLFTASYEIEPGVGRDIEVRMRSNQVGDFVVNGRIVYYFGDDMDGAEDHTLTLPITVRAAAEAGAERTKGTSESGGSSTPGFAAVVAVIGLLLAYVRRKA